MQIINSSLFNKWYRALRDKTARQRVQQRLLRVANGNFGDTKSVGGGVYEMRIHYGQGYRLYYKMRGDEIIILLCGGDKSTQDKDIATAKEIASEI